MTPIFFRSAARAFGSLFQPKMQWLAAIPVLVSLVLWGILLWLGLQPLIDWLGQAFIDNGWSAPDSRWLGVLKVAMVPLLAFLSLLPVMALSALVLVGMLAMPAIVSHVIERFYPNLEVRGRGGMVASLVLAAKTSLTFIVLWLAALPLYIVPPLAIGAHVLLWSWMTQRLFTFDALSLHASEDELTLIARRHRPNLLLMGVLSGLAGTIPSAVWLGGAVFSLVLFPVLAALSVWLFVMVFMFSGLWFAHYGLAALDGVRSRGI